MSDDDVTCCDGCTVNVNVPISGPAYGTQESVAKQRAAISQTRKLGIIQTGLGVIALVSTIGALVVGFMVNKLNYPVIDLNPSIATIMTLLSGYYALKVAGSTPSVQVSKRTRCYVVTHYVLCVTNITMAIITSSFAGWVLAVCHSSKAEDVGKCSPNHQLVIIFNIINLAVFLLVGLTCIWASILFCDNARVFGFQNEFDRIAQLEQTVARLQSQARASGDEAPPPYTAYDNKNYQTMYSTESGLNK